MTYRYETHLHTCEASACGIAHGRDYIPFYRDLGYHGLFVTDHFFGGNTAVNQSLPWRDQVDRFCEGYEQAKAEGDKRGVQVLQFNLDEGLGLFADQSFDVVLQIDTLQHLRNAETMLRETVRVGKQGIIAFPNFAYWQNRLSIARGRMPVNKRLPYEWYNTPNIRVGTYADFGLLAARNGLQVADAFGLHENQIIRTMPNLLASTAVYQVASK